MRLSVRGVLQGSVSGTSQQFDADDDERRRYPCDAQHPQEAERRQSFICVVSGMKMTRYEILERIEDALHHANDALANHRLPDADRVSQARRWIALARSYEVLLGTSQPRADAS
jgi:hypothetical protein